MVVVDRNSGSVIVVLTSGYDQGLTTKTFFILICYPLIIRGSNTTRNASAAT